MDPNEIANGNGAAQGGSAPNGAPGTGNAGAGAGSQPNGNAGGNAGLNRELLNPVLRGMNEEEMNQVFDTLLASVRQPQQAAPAPAPVREEPKVDYKELLDPSNERFNPEAAMSYFVQKNYAGLLGDINKRTIDSTFIGFRQQFPDFGEYENDIKALLANRDPLTISQQDVLGHYYAVKGYRETEKQQKARRAPTGGGTLPPSPPAPENTQPKLSQVEEEIARRMFPRSVDPIADYQKYQKMDENFNLKVPMGGGKFQ